MKCRKSVLLDSVSNLLICNPRLIFKNSITGLKCFNSHQKKNLVIYSSQWPVSIETSLRLMSIIRAIGKRIRFMLKYILKCASGEKCTSKKKGVGSGLLVVRVWLKSFLLSKVREH